MIHMKKLTPAILFILAVVSCQPRKPVVRDTIPYVKQLAADTAETYPLLASYLTEGAKGSIALIGEPEACLPLAERFLSTGLVDNVDGKLKRDNLPDFAGETFDVIMDQYNAPYIRMAASSPDSLREVAVHNAVMALDSVAYSNALDPGSRLRKTRAKVFVLASSFLAEYGTFDIDTLLKMAGREALIITQVDAMLDAAERQGCKRVAVWAPEQAKPAYDAAAKNYDMDVTVVSTVGNGILRPAFRDMLRLYKEVHPDGFLDAVLLDSFTPDLEELNAEKEHIHRQITEEDMGFDSMLAPNFQFIQPAPAITDACYRLLRDRNLFTHNIAYPSARYYRTEEDRDGGFVLVEIGANYLSAAVNTTPYVPDLD